MALWTVVKTANQTNLCKCVGIPIGTSVCNDQLRLPSLSGQVIKVMDDIINEERAEVLQWEKFPFGLQSLSYPCQLIVPLGAVFVIDFLDKTSGC